MMKFIAVFILASAPAFAAKPKATNVMKAPPAANKNMNFDSQVVEGEVYRPDYSVVTGESPGEGWGILRLRPSFRDHAATDTEESRK